MRNIRIKCAACALLAAGGIMAAHAAPSQDAVNKPQPQNATSKPHSSSAQVSHSKTTFGPKVSASALADMSGGSDVKNRVNLNGSVSDTRTRNVVTGMDTIGGDAFSNAAGLSVVIQNSGNSVLIQNSTVINLQLQK